VAEVELPDPDELRERAESPSSTVATELPVPPAERG